MDILWIFCKIISPIFGLIYALALLPWRFSQRTTLINAVMLIIPLTAINFFVVKNMHLIVAAFPAFDIIYRVGNISLVVIIALSLIKLQAKGNELIEYMAFSGFSILLCVWVVDTIAITFRTLFGQYYIELLCELLIHPAILLIVIQIRKPFLEVLMWMKNQLWSLCIVLAILMVTFFIQVSYSPPLELAPENIPIALMLCCITFAIYGLIFYLFRTISVQNKMKQNMQVMELYILSLERQNEIINQSAHKMALFRHDLRHTIQMMLLCVENGDMRVLLKLLEGLNQNMSVGIKLKTFTAITGHKLLDATLSYYINHAQELGIDITIGMEAIEKLEIDKTELTIVLSNALENAVNACKRIPENEKRVVRVEGRRRGNQYFLEISNTYTGEITFDHYTGLPTSRNIGHGLGSQSIAFFAQKYGAVLEYVQSDGWFHLWLLL